jgi:hypothetical protein
MRSASCAWKALRPAMWLGGEPGGKLLINSRELEAKITSQDL